MDRLASGLARVSPGRRALFRGWIPVDSGVLRAVVTAAAEGELRRRNAITRSIVALAAVPRNADRVAEASDQTRSASCTSSATVGARPVATQSMSASGITG